MTLNKDKDGYAKANGFWIDPEEVEQIENGTFIEFAKSRLKEMAKENNLKGLNGYSNYANMVSEFIGLNIDFTKIRNKMAKEFGSFEPKDIGFKLN